MTNEKVEVEKVEKGRIVDHLGLVIFQVVLSRVEFKLYLFKSTLYSRLK